MWLGLDPLYWIIMIPIFIFSMWASMSVKTTFNKYSKFSVFSGKKSAEIALDILNRQGLNNVRVVKTSGLLSDHYDPSKKEIRLSEKVYNSNSIAAVAVAAHETGHAIQHAEKHALLMFRNLIAPTASIGSNFSWFIIIAGFLIGSLGMIKIGIVLFSVVVLFQIVTLPVEIDASNKAKKLLKNYGLINQSELSAVNQVLNAAAMTYVAATASAIATLFYYLLRAGLLGSDD